MARLNLNAGTMAGEDSDEVPIHTHFLGLLYLIGAGLTALSLLLPHPGHGEQYIWAIVALAAAGGSALLVVADRMPLWGLHVALGVGSLMINAAILATGVAAGLYSLLFFWIAICAAYFFRPTVVIAHLAWALTAYAGVLAGTEGSVYPDSTRWVITAIALTVSAAMTSWLVATRAELASQARADPLTGVPNRRWMRAELDREIARATRQGFPLCAAVIDLDGFKLYNDTRGHAEGDRLLVDTTETWRRTLRPSDFLARLGGDEFVVLLPDIELEHAELAMHRLRESTPHGQTSSIGVAMWNRGEDGDHLLARADRGLYVAKAAGRDRVVVEPSIPEDVPAAAPSPGPSSISS
jgi:diguanylate cyclase (GGDEF)-like protein